MRWKLSGSRVFSIVMNENKIPVTAGHDEQAKILYHLSVLHVQNSIAHLRQFFIVRYD